MNWEAVGAIGEILGALVVFTTLVYLAIQVRYAKLSAVDANRLVRARGVTDMQLHMGQDIDGFNEWVKANRLENHYSGMSEALDITTEGAMKVESLCLYWFWLHWGQFSSQNTPEDLRELGQTVGKFYQLPAMRHCWQHSPYAKSLLDDAFVRFVEEAIQTQEKLDTSGKDQEVNFQ